jgi:hypothetical protein
MKVSGHLLVPATLPRERAPGTNYIRGWVGPRTGLNAPSRNRTPAVQPLARRHTDWATPVPKWMYMKIKFWGAVWIRPQIDLLNWPTSAEIGRWMTVTDRCTDGLPNMKTAHSIVDVFVYQTVILYSSNLCYLIVLTGIFCVLNAKRWIVGWNWKCIRMP